jgi:hypothetical protein
MTQSPTAAAVRCTDGFGGPTALRPPAHFLGFRGSNSLSLVPVHSWMFPSGGTFRMTVPGGSPSPAIVNAPGSTRSFRDTSVTTLPYDSIVGPKSGHVSINSFCVEQGRWTKRGEESSAYFSSSSSNLATNDLKCAVLGPGEASQAAVWTNVSKTQERLEKKLGGSVKSDASKSSLQLTMESPAVTAATAPYLKALTPAPDGSPDVIGCVMAVNGRVLSSDVYASRSLFKKLWPKQLSAGALEAFLVAAPGSSMTPTSEDAVREFLAEAEGGEPASEAVTERTYIHIRQTSRVLLMESCDRSRDNLVLHRAFLAR